LLRWLAETSKLFAFRETSSPRWLSPENGGSIYHLSLSKLEFQRPGPVGEPA